jgi:methanogen homocitrate synthase
MTYRLETCPYNKTDIRDVTGLTVYDSTLREGAQVPGVNFSIDDKLRIARSLDDIGVPQIETGFPCISEDEKTAVRKVKGLDLEAEILALSRLKRSDIDACIDCDVDLIMLFIATSDLHIRVKYGCTREDIIERMTDSIEYAKSHGMRASFSSEDATRTDLGFLKELFSIAEGLGAERLGIADTTGCAHPSGVRHLVRELGKTLNKPLSLHMHNDFGLALANALTGVEEGAGAVGVTVGGLGERAGNVPLEQFVVAMKVFYDVDLGVDTTGLAGLSRLVSEITGIEISPLAPWVGSNAFAHESGIHATAVLAEPSTYECVPPEFVGNRRRIPIGKGSGRKVIKAKLKMMGVEITDDECFEMVLEQVKTSKGSVSDEELKKMAERARKTGNAL